MAVLQREGEPRTQKLSSIKGLFQLPQEKFEEEVGGWSFARRFAATCVASFEPGSEERNALLRRARAKMTSEESKYKDHWEGAFYRDVVMIAELKPVNLARITKAMQPIDIGELHPDPHRKMQDRFD